MLAGDLQNEASDHISLSLVFEGAGLFKGIPEAVGGPEALLPVGSRGVSEGIFLGAVTQAFGPPRATASAQARTRGASRAARTQKMADAAVGKDKCGEQRLVSLPLSRIRVIMKSSPEVSSINQEALVLTAKATVSGRRGGVMGGCGH